MHATPLRMLVTQHESPSLVSGKVASLQGCSRSECCCSVWDLFRHIEAYIPVEPSRPGPNPAEVGVSGGCPMRLTQSKSP